MLALPALQSKSAVNLEGSWMWPALGRVQRCRSALRVVAKAVLPSIPPYNPHETKETGVPVTIHYMLLGRRNSSGGEVGRQLRRLPSHHGVHHSDHNIVLPPKLSRFNAKDITMALLLLR
ncbi:hypothetical protein KC348_g83 [Hortaea werneckii]|nr:hypothetical protein KC348_g83 [Hortaea werneckii]